MQDGCGSSRRGFSLLVVLMVVGVVMSAALGVYIAVERDATLAGEARRRREALETVEGGLSEIINDRRLLGLLPTAPGEAAMIRYVAPTDSAFEGSGDTYEGEIRLVRAAPVLESSQRRLRALIYEVRVRAVEDSGRTAEMEAMVYRLAESLGQPKEVYGR